MAPQKRRLPCLLARLLQRALLATPHCLLHGAAQPTSTPLLSNANGCCTATVEAGNHGSWRTLYRACYCLCCNTLRTALVVCMTRGFPAHRRAAAEPHSKLPAQRARHTVRAACAAQRTRLGPDIPDRGLLQTKAPCVWARTAPPCAAAC